uniref:Uncharacterized protein n=1 Tax=Glossina palpalis gambiensis TaxID=67801 RepID=A0A1B0BJ59_9MUSC
MQIVGFNKGWDISTLCNRNVLSYLSLFVGNIDSVFCNTYMDLAQSSMGIHGFCKWNGKNPQAIKSSVADGCMKKQKGNNSIEVRLRLSPIEVDAASKHSIHKGNRKPPLNNYESEDHTKLLANLHPPFLFCHQHFFKQNNYLIILLLYVLRKYINFYKKIKKVALSLFINVKSREQTTQKFEKRARTRTFKCIRKATGSYVPLWSQGFRVCLATPCTDEPRICLEKDDIIRVTRFRRH